MCACVYVCVCLCVCLFVCVHVCVHACMHCKKKIVLQLCDYTSYSNSKNVVLVKKFVGGE